MKKCMSVFTAFLLSFCIIIAPMTTVAAVDDTTPADDGTFSGTSMENDMSVVGTNSFGNLLSEEFADKQAEQQENMGNNIFSVEVENNVAKVDFETTENSTLIVGIYDEDGIQMITSASIAVTPDQKNTTVELDNDKMPEYFYIKAFIVDSNTLRPMCTSYESPNYTKEMQEFLSKTTDDFEQEKVLNLDEDKSNNFAVYSDDTKIITESAEHNQVLSVDDENQVYVIGNIDSSVSSLKTGDVFAQNYDENNILIVKVATISIDGTTAIITGQETDMEEVFDYIKIDTVSDIGEADVNTDGMDDDMTFEGMSEEKTTSSSAKSTSTSGSKGVSADASASVNTKFLKYEFEKEFYNSTNDPLDNGHVEPISVAGKVKGSVELSMKLTFKLHLTTNEKYLEIKFDYKFSSQLNATVKADFKLQIGELCFSPVVGVYIKLQPCLVLKISGEINVKITVSGSIGSQLSLKSGAKNISKSPSIDIQGEAKVTIFAGLSLEPSITILHENVSKASMEAQFGVELKADLKTGVTFAEERHPCIACISGEANGKITLKMTVTFLKKHSVELKPIDITIPIGKFYYSIDYGEFGWGKCPHKEYRCTVTVEDANGDTVKGAVINDKYQTNEDGKVNIYFKPEKVTLTAKKDNATGTYTGEIDSPKSIIIKLGSSQTDTSGSGSSSGGNSSNSGSSWGNAQSGITADTDYYDSNIEIEELAMSLNSDWKNIISNGSTTAGITKNNELYMWGYNSKGQLGNGTTINSSVPIKIMDNVKSVALGGGHSAAITLNGELYTWGSNSQGQLGDGTTTDSYTPIKVMNNVRSVSLGGSYSAAITKSNELYTWGYNGNHQLGTKDISTRYIPNKIMNNVKSIYLRGSSTAIINYNYELYTCGEFRYGYELSEHSISKKLDNVRNIYFGNVYAAITNNNELYMWGYSSYDGALSSVVSSGTTVTTPTKIMDNIINFSMCGRSISAVNSNNELYTWGYNSNGQLGNGTSTNFSTPFKVLDNVKQTVMTNDSMYIVSRNTNNPIIINENDLYMCGRIPNGNGSNAYYFTPYKNSNISNIVYMSNDGYDNVIFMTANGNWYICGNNSYGQLGNNSTTSNGIVPQKISIPKSTSTSARTRNGSTKMTKTFSDLVPNETYNFYVLKDTTANELLNGENLYYIAQGQADDDGKLKFDYIPTESYEKAYHFVVAMHRTDLSYAKVVTDTLTYNAEEQYIKPSVKLDGVYLVEGVDYELTGKYSATEPGEYTATINGIGRYTGKVDFTYTIIPDFVNLSTLDKTQLYLGDTITITASAAGGEGAYTYSYYFRNTEELYWIPLETDTTESVIEFEPEEIGKYYARIDVKDEDGKVKRKAIVFTVNSRNLANQSFVSSESVKVGDTVTLYGDAMGGTKPYNYAYYIKDMFDDTWTLLKTYSATDKFDVTFAKEGTYDVCIRVKDLNSTIAKKYFVIDVEPKKVLPLTNTSTLLSENVKLGGTIDIKASAIGGNGNYQYAAYYKKANDTKWITKQGFKDNTDISIKPAYAALYNVCVKVQDESGTIEKQYFEVNVISDKLENTSTISTDTITLGEKVGVQGSATGGTGSYQYQVVYKQTSQSKWTTAQAFSENTTVTFKPAKATSYDVCVKVKDSNGTIVKKFFTVQVNAKLTNTSAVSATTIKKGNTVAVNGSATGGAGDYTYAVFYKQKSQSKWTTKQDFNDNADVSIKPAQATDYNICVKVKDKDSTIVKKYFTVTVTK